MILSKLNQLVEFNKEEWKKHPMRNPYLVTRPLQIARSMQIIRSKQVKTIEVFEGYKIELKNKAYVVIPLCMMIIKDGANILNGVLKRQQGLLRVSN
jgi:hypothetical protein